MIYLVLAVLTQVSNAMVVKWGETRRQDRVVVMGVNYVWATLAALALWTVQGNALPSTATVVLGVVGGVFYSTSLFLWMRAVGKAGVATATAAMRLSVLWPTVLSVLAFGEIPNSLQLTGVCLAFGVLVLLAVNALAGHRGSLSESGLSALLAVFVVNGGSGSTQKLFTEFSAATDRNALLVLIFLTAAVLCWLVIGLGRRRPHRQAAVLGVLFGTGNVTANSLLLVGLRIVPGVIAFPLVNTGVILLATLAGVALWRERPGGWGYTAIAVAGVAIALMTLGGH